MAGKEIEYITPPNDLRKKQKMAGVTGVIDAGWMEAAERSITTAKFDYLTASIEDLARLQAAYDAAVKDPANRVENIQHLYAQVQAIKGQGTSFGYPLMTAVGNQLARFIEDSGDNLTDPQLEVVKIHMEALRLVMQQKMEGDGGPVGQKLVAGLGLVIKKMIGETPPAAAPA
jgi:hypothetical protein